MTRGFTPNCRRRRREIAREKGEPSKRNSHRQIRHWEQASKTERGGQKTCELSAEQRARSRRESATEKRSTMMGKQEN